ncbi:hypothetical protein EG329_004536 [Mollisiaceae sp. DMI_Dod_QoI]|nr:hypothetical protein EG329_004536 [Helotiales sp. DMI_Dod_QoI]
MASSISPVVSETMERLSAKPGVTAALAIDRASSSLLQFKGDITALLLHIPVVDASAAAGRTPTTTGTVSGTAPGTAASSAEPGLSSAAGDGINEFARMIWKYVNSTGQLVQDMDVEDDLKLLRLRTKKHELVIVPDSKFIFVVVHDVKST